jgi:transcriptional regulator with XRE-family HTH domain
LCKSKKTVLAPVDELKATIALREIATRLWKLRTSRKLEPDTVAKEVDISPRMLRKVESCRYNFTLDVLFRLCAYYRVNPDEVFLGSTEKETEQCPL